MNASDTALITEACRRSTDNEYDHGTVGYNTTISGDTPKAPI